MTDKELLLQATGLPTVYLDGFGAFRKINGVLRCVGFTIGNGAQLNLIVSLSGAEAGCIEAQRLLDEKPTRCIAIMDRMKLAH